MTLITKILALFCSLLLWCGEIQALEHTDAKNSQSYYTVKQGDNLTHIARSFGLANYASIAKANRIANPNKIKAGVTIVIPSEEVAGNAVATLATEAKLKECANGSTTHTEGTAAQYADRAYAGKTGSGETYDATANTIAHRTLPFGTLVCVQSVASGNSVVARVNDRIRMSKTRHLVVLSASLAGNLGIKKSGVGMVQVAILTPPAHAPLGAGDALSLRKAVVATHGDNVVEQQNAREEQIRNIGRAVSKMAEAFPPDKSLPEIQQALQQIVGPEGGADVTQLAALIYLQKRGGDSLRNLQSAEAGAQAHAIPNAPFVAHVDSPSLPSTHHKE